MIISYLPKQTYPYLPLPADLPADLLHYVKKPNFS